MANVGQSGGNVYICNVKTTLRHTVPLLLALCVLLGSVGIALSEQLCLMTGLRQVEALAHADGCCEGEKAANEEDSCCTEEVTFAKLETVSSQKALAIALPVFFHKEVKPVFEGVLNSLPTDQRLLTYADSSPPLYGRRLLHLLQVLII
ncbi:hypothetical protein DXT99_07150 [Pontibacter diazotrophicus]|uniref:Uncharacterized protein n=1 Tax=Pontibacter diazotrophicus TaxID=1400979 RepID=A0A3D8LEF7_9BACT|nr:hypothetical protein [Pontibacter diazotrophicus]RDV15777.1 hypothetical protein DXT99_07150 [Pontibacter diazotrophicus]